MRPIEFLDIYDPLKKNDISSIRLFYDVMKGYTIKDDKGNDYYTYDYYKVAINNDIPLNREDFTVWTEEYYDYMVNFVGTCHSEILIHSAPKERFTSLDEFMYYVRLIEHKNNIPNSFINYPHLKEHLLSEADFRRELYFNIDTMFMNKEDEVLLGIPIANYVEGYYYFNISSGCILGCDLTDKYLALGYWPYI